MKNEKLSKDLSFLKNLHKENSEKLETFLYKSSNPSDCERIALFNEIRERENEIRRVHRYIKKKKEKSEFCIICNRFDVKLQLANIDHKYSKNVKDYIWLCAYCHSLFDRFKGLKKLSEYYQMDIEMCLAFGYGYTNRKNKDFYYTEYQKKKMSEFTQKERFEFEKRIDKWIKESFFE